MQLALWRRAVIVSTAAGFPDLPFVQSRVYYSATAFKELFETFFGEEIAEQFRDILSGMILITNEMVEAIDTEDRERADEITVRMYQNADKVAKFFAQINPYWDEEKWRNLFYGYYKTIFQEVVTIMSGKYEESIAVYQTMEDQSQKIADYMAAGLIDYFI